jgi:hypothetical protein
MRRLLGTLSLLTVLALVAPAALAATWTEVGDAPALLPGQQTNGAGMLDLINGNFTGYYDVDMYEIKIVDHTIFSASTVGLTTADTRLYLFNPSGVGVTYDDDTGAVRQSTLTNQFVTANGTYYLAVTRYNIIAAAAGSAPGNYIWNMGNYQEHVPDGPSATSPLTQWLGAAMYADTTYGVDLKGVQFSVPEPGTLGLLGLALIGLRRR